MRNKKALQGGMEQVDAEMYRVFMRRYGRVGCDRYTPSLLAASTVISGRAGAALGSDESCHGCG